MGLIDFVLNIVRKIFIAFFALIALILFAVYFLKFDSIGDPNFMLGIIIVPLFIISCLVKDKK